MSGAVLFAYVLWASAPATSTTPLLARAILEGATLEGGGAACPSLVIGGVVSAMAARVNPDPKRFPVTVCEGVLTPGVSAQLVPAGSGLAIALPIADSDPRTIALVGDTGCRGEPKQSCDKKSWGWPDTARRIAEAKPGLIVSLGDLNYRAVPSKVKIKGEPRQRVFDGCPSSGGVADANVKKSQDPDTWASWNADFFTPAAPALAAAPWVVVRGNHELCARSGPGWHYFLEPRGVALDPAYAQETCEAGLPAFDSSPPYAVNLKRLRLVVMDSATACDGVPEPGQVPGFTRQFAQLPGLAGDGPAWLLTHRPLWGVLKAPAMAPLPDDAADTDEDQEGTLANVTLQTALAQSRAPLPPNLAMVVSGHIHRFQALSFPVGGGRPPQLVLGDGGVNLSGGHQASTISVPIDGQTAQVTVEARHFAYMLAEVAGDGSWRATVFAAKGKPAATLATCGKAQTPVCGLSDHR